MFERVPAGPLSEWFRTPAGRRATGISTALLLEGLLLLLLSSLGVVGSPQGKRPALVSFTASSQPESAPEPAKSSPPEPEVRAEERPEPRPHEPTPPQPAAPPAAPPIIPVVREAPPAPAPPPPRPAPPADGPVYGPPDTGSPASTDSARVGTAPNGEPLYAARWYREPYDDELRGYLSTATGPGWGLIACRTAPDFRVEDCIALEESPRGSLINRAILAAAWQFKVRPPRLGGRALVGAWVRIRIDYNLRPPPAR